MTFKRSIIVGAALLFAGLGAAQAQSVRLLGDYNDWSAYTTSDGAGKLCFVLSKPQDIRPQPEGYTASYLYLTHRPAEGIRNEFNFVAGYTMAPERDAMLKIGSSDYVLFVETDAAWLDDPALSEDVAGSMRAGSSLTIISTTADGVEVTETFSLSGVTAASRAIDRECG